MFLIIRKMELDPPHFKNLEAPPNLTTCCVMEAMIAVTDGSAVELKFL